MTVRVTVWDGRVFDFSWNGEDVNIKTLSDDELSDLLTDIIDEREGIEEETAPRGLVLDEVYNLVIQESASREKQGQTRVSYGNRFDVVEDLDGEGVIVMLDHSEDGFAWVRFDGERPSLLLNEKQLSQDEVRVMVCDQEWEAKEACVNGLHLLKPSCEREVVSMFSKAMCAYANWRATDSAAPDDSRFRHESQYEVSAAQRSEYESTVRCLALFVKEPVSDICLKVIDQVEREFWGWTPKEGQLAETKGGLRR